LRGSIDDGVSRIVQTHSHLIRSDTFCEIGLSEPDEAWRRDEHESALSPRAQTSDDFITPDWDEGAFTPFARLKSLATGAALWRATHNSFYTTGVCTTQA
jgi:hypothetical protein